MPVIVSGSWDNPSFRPDLKALVGKIIKDPKKAVKDVKKTIKEIKRGGVSGLLEGLAPPTSAPAGDGSGTAPVPPKVDPKQLLKGLFGG